MYNEYRVLLDGKQIILSYRKSSSIRIVLYRALSSTIIIGFLSFYAYRGIKSLFS